MFVVYKAQLQKLFGICHYTGCGKPLLKTASFQVHGFATNIETHCIEGHRFKWEAHSKIKHVYAGNLLIPSALFLSGNSYTTFQETCQILHLASLSVRECNNIQNAYIIPEIAKVWQQHTESIMGALGNTPLDVSGDARCDSPGYSATYGTYTIMHVDSHLILAQETIHVTEVNNSYWLEPEGLQRCLNSLQVGLISYIHTYTHTHTHTPTHTCRVLATYRSALRSCNAVYFYCGE